MSKKSAQKGFTLVELLVVISIIAVLSAIGLNIYGSAQKSGRMAKRIGDLTAIQTALEVYYAANKAYPLTTAGNWRTECSGWISVAANDVIPGLVSTYMPAFPADPAMNKAANTSCYLYQSDGNDYKVLDHNVPEITVADLQANRNFWDPSNPSYPAPTSCPSHDELRRMAIWSSNTSKCW